MYIKGPVARSIPGTAAHNRLHTHHARGAGGALAYPSLQIESAWQPRRIAL